LLATSILLLGCSAPQLLAQDDYLAAPASGPPLAILEVKMPGLTFVELVKLDKTVGMKASYTGNYEVKKGDKPVDVANGLAKSINDEAGKELVTVKEDQKNNTAALIPVSPYVWRVISQPTISILLP
jgi:hypothetical protein